jgi:hypothetical protein
VLPGVVLAARGEQALQLGLGLLRGGEFFEVLGKAVFLGDEHGLAQQIEAQVQVAAGQRIDDGVGRLLRRLVGLGPQRLGAGQPALVAGVALQRVGGLVESGQFGQCTWNGGTEASTTPAPSARSNSTRLASAAASALCVCERPWRATTAS